MIEFLTTNNTLAHLERVIDQAHQQIVLISPYVQIPPGIQRRLQSAAARGVPTAFVYGKKLKLKDEQFLALGAVPGLQLGFLESLHAKCYFSDAGLILTSLNLYEASRDNWEMGVFATPDEPLYADAAAEASRIMQAATLMPIQQVAQHLSTQAALKQIAGQLGSTSAVKEAASPYRSLAGRSRKSAAAKGHCIRCSDAIALNPNVPHCKKCYRSWKRFENRDYQENHCHDCGQKQPTSVAKPLCRACFPRHRAAFR